MRRTLVGLAIAAVLPALLALPACATDANSVTACRQLENARCARAQSCGIDLSTPLHTGVPGTAAQAIEACQLFYYDACLHGLATPVVPNGQQVTQCLDTIMTGDCNAVITPQNEPACSWLIPPDAGVDSGITVTTDATSTMPDVVVVVTPPVDASSDGAADGQAVCYASCSSMCVGDPNCTATCEANCQGQ